MTQEPEHMVDKLSDEAVEAALAELADWSRSGDSIQRTFAFGGFRASSLAVM